MSVVFKKDLLYMQLKEAILSGKYPPGTKFPREVEFASQLGVGFVTLRSAFKRLEEEGLISRLRSCGTFVNEISDTGVKNNEKTKIMLVFRGYHAAENLTDNIFNRNLAAGVFAQAAFLNMAVEVEIFPPETSMRSIFLTACKRNCSALILDRYPLDFLAQAASASPELPFVIINREFDGIPSVSCNYVAGIRMVVKRLRELGHREILFFDHSNPQVPNFLQRQQAFISELAQNGLHDAGQYLVRLDDTLRYECLPMIAAPMQKLQGVTAVVIQSFFIDAFTQYLNDSGISVPEDLSVIQWGERKGCERTSSLPYSLLTEPRSECGHAAVDLISRMFQGEDCSSYKVKITPELIMRNGCSLPRTLGSHLLNRDTAYQVCL